MDLTNVDTVIESFQKAPLELQEKMIQAKAAYKRWLKAEKQKQLWTQEADISAFQRDSTLNDFNIVLTRWNPTTNEIEKLEEKEQKLENRK